MAGASIKITVRDAELRQALDRVSAGLLPAVMKNIGQALVKGVRQRFAEQKAPDGQPWQPLNPDYARSKRGSKILQEQGMRGGLLGSITYVAGADYVAVGTNKVYGAIHQFGGTIVPRSGDRLIFRLGNRTVFARKVTIPARPFLGLSDADRQAVLEVISDHIKRVWEG